MPVDALVARSDATLLVRFDPGAGGAPGGATFVAVAVLARDARFAAIEPLAGQSLDDGAAIVLIGKENVTPGAQVMAVGIEAAGAARHP